MIPSPLLTIVRQTYFTHVEHLLFLNYSIGKNISVIVNGASSSVGAYAVQLAKRAGIFVVAIAGASWKYVDELGADVIVDYRKYKTPEELVSLPVITSKLAY